ncbi:MAG: TlpA family protein disulfide reductase, partial [Opitutaceae bacterium]
MKKSLFILLAAGLVPAALPGQTPAALSAPAVPQPTLAAGATAPDFTTVDVAGKEVRLSDFKGKILVLDFWATWCGPCIASFPHTQEVAAKYKDQGVVVLAAGTSDTKEKFLQWIPANQGKYPDIRFTYDPKERGDDRASAKLYRVRGIPTQFIIGRDGVIAAVVVGNSPGDARAEASLAKLGVKVDA